MSWSHRLYAAVERIIGRRSAWRIGRWLYAGSRRELENNPRVNGEYALQSWVIDACSLAGDQEAVFFDVGANLGDWSFSLLQRLSASPALRARIVAFEPAPAQSRALTKRLEQGNEVVRIECHEEALGDAPGEGRLRVTGESTGDSALLPCPDQDGTESLGVRITTVDAVMERERVERVTLLKIDTEGNDFNVIRGAREAMARCAIDVVQFEYNWRWINFGHSMRSVFIALGGTDYSLGRLSCDGIELYERWHPELDRFIETNFVLLAPRLKAHLPAKRMTFDSSNVAVESGPRDNVSGMQDQISCLFIVYNRSNLLQMAVSALRCATAKSGIAGEFIVSDDGSSADHVACIPSSNLDPARQFQMVGHQSDG